MLYRYNQRCGNIEPTTRYLDLFSPLLSCSPYTLYAVKFQFTGHSVDLSDNDWLFPHHWIQYNMLLLTPLYACSVTYIVEAPYNNVCLYDCTYTNKSNIYHVCIHVIYIIHKIIYVYFTYLNMFLSHHSIDILCYSHKQNFQ